MTWNGPKALVIYRREKGITPLQSSIHETYHTGVRYINMDFFFYSSLKDTAIKLFVVSYDIVCQWFKNFYSQMEEAFPLSWRINTSDVDIRFLVPKFHLPAHIERCQQLFHLIMPSLLVGLMERLWSGDGPISMVFPTALEKWDLEHVRTPLRTI